VKIVAVFLDASYFLALYNEDDIHHKKVLILANKIDSNEYGRAITSDDVFDEVVSVALRKFGKEKAQIFGKQIISSTIIIHGDNHIFDAALKLFNSSKDSFSFTDCTSQAIMDLGQIEYIATFDKLFENSNFKVVR